MKGDRTKRLASLIKEEIAKIFVKDFRNEGLTFVSVTKVVLTKDLRNAKVFCSAINSDTDEDKHALITKLIKHKKVIRKKMGDKLKLRHVPSLDFFYDDSMEYAEHINTLINKIQDS